MRWLASVDFAESVDRDAGSDRDGDDAPAYVAGDALESDSASLARAYYDALDAGEYDRLEALLDPDFVQRRPDRTFEGRDRFVAFMRDERPLTDTTHVVDGVFPEGPGVAVHGRLLDADGEELFAFVDAFDVDDGRLTALETYAGG
ncbi:nuclear transport factor 2 family protein [Halorubrum sp. DTA46]|uniref:nuclear transport factor 2 family protein n=1 Tax=Halorubrum sp. DTA46 TaxID=3402162 RepID=UPI003AAECA2C